jgi:hypothetical protein
MRGLGASEVRESDIIVYTKTIRGARTPVFGDEMVSIEIVSSLNAEISLLFHQ